MKCNYNINLEDLNGLECWGGLDLASTRDISALVLIFKLKDYVEENALQ
jgi:phage terminase large subunit-like protein